MKFGSGDHRFELVEGWPQRPDDLQLGWIGGIGVTSSGRAYVYNRGDFPMAVFDAESGAFIETWDEPRMVHAHAVWVDGDDRLWLTDQKAHVIWICDEQGNILDHIGNEGQKGAVDGAPFNEPTDIALAGDLGFFVSDGYGNSHVHHLAPDYSLVKTWGGRGDGPGVFNLPHCVHYDTRGRVWVADRENNRVQLFDAEGNFLESWTDLLRPADFVTEGDDLVYVCELGGRLSVMDLDGGIVERFNLPDPQAPHGIWLDGEGNLYVCEVQADNKLYKLARC